jgi:hypothetical protein
MGRVTVCALANCDPSQHPPSSDYQEERVDHLIDFLQGGPGNDTLDGGPGSNIVMQ